ncbi:D-tyrosyl-tRNA(Tyr) deacylase [Candidatus Dependentiae bacterium]|nr:D-tyrosyl-tRNA(Tyr) deacylase [Candidatus Dependentiae bacterium]
MKVIIQRVGSASVCIDKKLISQIEKGFLILVGISKDDTQKDIDYISKKILNLRIFESDNGYFDKSIQDINGEILFVSQFTLYADCTKGNRPSFSSAMSPEQAKIFYKNFLDDFKKLYPKIKDGQFGAKMQVELVNDGPVSIILDSKK